jgi:hypothetical protein
LTACCRSHAREDHGHVQTGTSYDCPCSGNSSPRATCWPGLSLRQPACGAGLSLRQAVRGVLPCRAEVRCRGLRSHMPRRVCGRRTRVRFQEHEPLGVSYAAALTSTAAETVARAQPERSRSPPCSREPQEPPCPPQPALTPSAAIGGSISTRHDDSQDSRDGAALAISAVIVAASACTSLLGRQAAPMERLGRRPRRTQP